MVRVRCTDERIVWILQEADRASVAEFAKHRGVTEPSIYDWLEKCGNIGKHDVKRPKQLE
jgi:hypothetical protein